MANFGVIFGKWLQFLQIVYMQSFSAAKNHSHKKARLFYSPSACNEVAPAGVSEEQRFRGCWMRIEAAALMPGGWSRAILQIAEHGGGAFVA